MGRISPLRIAFSTNGASSSFIFSSSSSSHVESHTTSGFGLSPWRWVMKLMTVRDETSKINFTLDADPSLRYIRPIALTSIFGASSSKSSLVKEPHSEELKDVGSLGDAGWCWLVDYLIMAKTACLLWLLGWWFYILFCYLVISSGNLT